MSNGFPKVSVARFALLAGLIAACFGGAASAHVAANAKPVLQIQLADSTILVPREPAPIAPIVVQPASAIELAPAPVPDLDVSGPLGALPEARLTPALLSRNTEFEGDGFSHGSNRDYSEDQRESPAAGVNLSVPVK